MKRIVLFVLGFVAVVGLGWFSLLIGFAEPELKGPSDADITALAQDAYVIVGDVPLMLPYVAMPDQISAGQFFSLDRRAVQEQWRKDRDAFRLAASSAKGAPVLERVAVRVETYGWDDFSAFAWKKICSQLTRKWSQSVCDDPWAPLQQALPRQRFYLADDRHLDAFQWHQTAGREIVADQLRAMDLQGVRASAVCDRELNARGRSCTAGVLISQHLMAVWSVWDSENERAEQQADREGRAIVAFVNYALGAEEDFEALLAVVCTVRRPGSGPSGIANTPADPCDV
ncbi:hypothetical protein [Cypionkella sp.]|uniref:hypothetical protein n=1 Tax=Cypionkella sp. TaxID=2811411 RepID=UPI002ABC10A1|nr:hypothetical protein [Cypionkella sp.]MDZ4394957.1 hypothetical protein [Cypionkella sp.]